MTAARNTPAWCAVAVVIASQVAVVLAQAPDFSGTWKLDASRSRVTSAAGLAGLVGAGVPDTLHITQPANGALFVESQINESHARVYTPGGKSSTPAFVGQAGKITMTSRWEGRSLVSEGSRESVSGTSTLVTEVKEVFGLSADGQTLTIEIATTGADAKSASTALYSRTRDVGLCHTWPTPCKSPSR